MPSLVVAPLECLAYPRKIYIPLNKKFYILKKGSNAAEQFAILLLGRNLFMVDQSGRVFSIAISALPCVVILINNENQQKRSESFAKYFVLVGGFTRKWPQFVIGHIRQAVELLQQGNAAESVGRIETAQNFWRGCSNICLPRRPNNNNRNRRNLNSHCCEV
ncbi:hypothetical protein niasHT_014117 [Heterodera trifolii]|uniref:Uncharacterized protein n=1 Tax=Heterodera trifolii TaxID=157864 RepID=A0ABD2LGC3_9BILA